MENFWFDNGILGKRSNETTGILKTGGLWIPGCFGSFGISMDSSILQIREEKEAQYHLYPGR
jgi:hypothetical protein